MKPAATSVSSCPLIRLPRVGRKAKRARARHKLRIRAKKLRYMIEFFGDVFPGHKNVKRREAALNSLKKLQDTLGSPTTT